MNDTTTTGAAGAAAGAEATETEGGTHLGWALVIICVAQLVVVLDGMIVNIALPYIQSDLDIAQSN